MSQIFSTSPSVLKLLAAAKQGGATGFPPEEATPAASGTQSPDGGCGESPADTVQAPCSQDGKDGSPVVSVQVPGEQEWNIWVLGHHRDWVVEGR